MLLPCIGNISYWKEIIHSREVSLFTNHTFQKQSDLSQFEIATANGRLKLSIPTIKSTRKRGYDKVEIDYSSNWVEEHWRSIENAYQKSPFFLYYGYKIEAVLYSKPMFLLDLNKILNEKISKCIKLNKRVYESDVGVYFKPQNRLDHPKYPQVFDTRHEFEANLSILDLIFNLGPEAKDYLEAD